MVREQPVLNVAEHNENMALLNEFNVSYPSMQMPDVQIHDMNIQMGDAEFETNTNQQPAFQTDMYFSSE